MGDPTFWDDPEKAQKTAQDVNSLKEEVDGFHKLSAGVDDLEALQEMAAEENDESLLPEMDELLANAAASWSIWSLVCCSAVNMMPIMLS